MKFLKLFEDFENKITKKIFIGEIPVLATIAETEQQQQKGYMFSSGPKDGEGMLFVYPNEQILTFWMKNVTIPLDILFFDSKMDLVDYQSMFPYDDEKEVHYNSKIPSKFAVEVPHGWIDGYLGKNDTKLKFN